MDEEGGGHQEQNTESNRDIPSPKKCIQEELAKKQEYTCTIVWMWNMETHKPRRKETEYCTTPRPKKNPRNKMAKYNIKQNSRRNF